MVLRCTILEVLCLTPPFREAGGGAEGVGEPDRDVPERGEHVGQHQPAHLASDVTEVIQVPL